MWYAIVSVYWMLDGAVSVAIGAGLFSDSQSPIRIVIGLALFVVGAGLLFRVRFLRGVAHILCWLTLADGLMMFLTSLLLTIALGPLAYILSVLGLVRAASAGFMIYLIGETESHFPMWGNGLRVQWKPRKGPNYLV